MHRYGIAVQHLGSPEYEEGLREWVQTASCLITVLSETIWHRACFASSGPIQLSIDVIARPHYELYMP